MTRDEAIAKAEEGLNFPRQPGANSIEARKFVDMAVALGILKLVEPKDAMEKFIIAMESQGYQRQSVGMRDAITAIKSAKIKLVDE